MDKLSPTDDEVIQAIKPIHKQNPDWGTTKIATAIRTSKTQWTLSEKRIKKLIQVRLCLLDLICLEIRATT
jgi:hypothetical protein